MSETTNTPADLFGSNSWLVDEMYEQYLVSKTSVPESWQEFFLTYRVGAPAPAPASGAGAAPIAVGTPPSEVTDQTPSAATPAAEPTAAVDQPVATSQPVAPSESTTAPTNATPTGETLRGVAAKIVSNMEASLGVPTATSVRDVPARLLEVNRKILNNHLNRTRGGKISFTHLIAWAIVEACDEVPAMRNTYSSVDGIPTIYRNDFTNLGIAVDMEKSDGSRSLVVPAIKDASATDFAGFWLAYEALINKARKNKLTIEDMTGTTVTITNPGGIGTVHSVPRLMPGQAVIVGLGAIDFPAEFAAADPEQIARLGVSKIITLTSTYDHRIIQGAESGLFLQHVHHKLIGKDGFYDRVFSSLGVPYEPARWQQDHSPADSIDDAARKQIAVIQLVAAYREYGHLIASIDPLERTKPTMPAVLDPVTYGLTIWDLEREYLTGGVGGVDSMRLENLLGMLRDAYCRTVGIEYSHVDNLQAKAWLQSQVEGVRFTPDKETQAHILDRLNAAEAFEAFLKTRYVGVKRFGLEGGESAIVASDAICTDAAKAGLSDVVIGMAHRGRLNTLINIVGKSYADLFREFEGYVDDSMVQGSGDVKYHMGHRGSFTASNGSSINVSLSCNPSHLETVDPVVEGIVRAKNDAAGVAADSQPHPAMALLIHGDAAFMGQGVVAETLNFARVPAYANGGTIHLIINNQVGFTTNPIDGRSTRYCSDMAKAFGSPVFHVNGDDPEAVLRVAKLAFAYRQKFGDDVVIDLVCYRRMGHNEADEPSYTQPLMYKLIEAKPSVRESYTNVLVKRGDITLDEANSAVADFQAKLQAALDATRQTPAKPTALPPAREIKGVMPSVATGLSAEIIEWVANVTHTWPDSFTIHPKLGKQLEGRAKEFASGEIDWALGEALAFGTTLYEGNDVRLVGQDVRRGTFSHRHAALNDYVTGERYVPLNHLRDGQGEFRLFDSALSEYAALGFEYGYSTENPNALVIWEAQFGDFVNGAQIVIDQYISAAEDKWGVSSGLVMLLPHGFEGQGPEHSSARIERFLTLAAEDNWQIANVTTAAQYFHLLRRQLHRSVRKPLIVFTPKSGLRAKYAKSDIGEFLPGTTFHEVLDDDAVQDPSAIKRVVFASGKVGAEAAQRRDEAGVAVAVVRVEQLYPFPAEQITQIAARYTNATEVVWLQEEPENMGAWPFVADRIRWTIGDRSLRVCSRLESASPASGSAYVHGFEQDDVLTRAVTWGLL